MIQRSMHTPADPEVPPRDRHARWTRRRLTMALTGAALVASMLPIAAGPAHAAAVDVTSDRLWGATRYETAVEIAEEYIDELGGSRADVDTIVLASGADEHFGYALVAPALSRRYEAPLLLTEPGQLSPATSNFLHRNDIETVFILGSTDVVSAAVERSVERIRGTTVVRVAGSDVYDTAVTVAERVGPRAGEPGNYRSAGRTVLLATGEVFADALAAGPLAYRGEHPILLTQSNELHADVARFLDRSDTDHVVILGGAGAIGTGVERAVRDQGMTVDRLWGADRFATAVRIAQELLGDSPPQSCFSGGEIGLAYGRKAADAIASGPLLGELCAPLLLTELGELPGASRQFLESDDYEMGDLDGDLRITVFGGRLAVSPDAVAQADAAATLDPIRARITATEGRCHFVVTFDEPVLTRDVEDIRNYRIEGDTLDSGQGNVDAGTGTTTSRATVVLQGAVSVSDATIPVGCSAPLIERDEVEIVDEAIGTENDRRTVRRVSTSVRSDRSRPRLTITALDGSDFVYIETSEPLEPGTSGNPQVQFERSGVTDEFVQFRVGDGALRYEVAVPLEDGLKAGDRVTIEDDEVEDLAGNLNREVTATARRDSVAPRVSRVEVTEPAGRSASFVTVDGRYSGRRIDDALTITAKATGEAYGAIGNDWTLRIDLESSWPATQTSEVDVSTRNRRIEVRVGERRTLDQLAADFNNEPEFKALFDADTSGTSSTNVAVVNDNVRAANFRDGSSTVDLTVLWTEQIRDCEAFEGAVQPGLLELDADGDGEYDFYLDGRFAARLQITFVDAPDGNPAIVGNEAVCDTAPGVVPGTLVARLESPKHSSLPSLRSQLFSHARAATDLKGNESVNRRISNFVRP
ncbi:cell wall-binding repeat-containing protein [Candidatus Poriferisodalis sp.]|uniref:cell wall-binding repeat-containing protein n=1 Tax=Candidatus Poriferisodalis sp. TaxID=3101277 RepID=UPI003C705194